MATAAPPKAKVARTVASCSQLGIPEHPPVPLDFPTDKEIADGEAPSVFAYMQKIFPNVGRLVCRFSHCKGFSFDLIRKCAAVFFGGEGQDKFRTALSKLVLAP